MPWQISKTGRLDELIVFAYLGREPVPLGKLVFLGDGKRRESRFAYARSWIQRANRFAIAPAGIPVRAAEYASLPHEVPLAFYDAAPDGWGKGVLEATFPNQYFGMAEYLAAAGDDRTGALGFGNDPAAGPQRWIPDMPRLEIPPELVRLEDLQAAAEALDEGKADRSQLRLLFESGTDAGGARPKSRVYFAGAEWIAKFKTWSDIFDEPKVEAAILSLAELCGIPVPVHRVESVAGRSVLLVRRFDRSETGERLPYISAATLSEHPPVEYTTKVTYADLAAVARRAGVSPCEAEIFRRMLFDCFVNNTDHHLRNTAFLAYPGDADLHWRLSPAFDVVPGRQRSLVMRPAAGIDPVTDPTVAFAAHKAMQISRDEAQAIYEDVAAGMSRLPALLEEFEVGQTDRETIAVLMPHAFSIPRLLDRRN